jgi:spore maturation protein CgeB
MAGGAIVLTEQGAQLNDVFSDSDYVGFSVKGGAKEFSDQLDWLLSNDSKRIDMARKTQDKVFAYHTWDARTDSIVRAIKEAIV